MGLLNITLGHVNNHVSVSCIILVPLNSMTMFIIINSEDAFESKKKNEMFSTSWRRNHTCKKRLQF